MPRGSDRGVTEVEEFQVWRRRQSAPPHHVVSGVAAGLRSWSQYIVPTLCDLDVHYYGRSFPGRETDIVFSLNVAR